MKGTRGKFPLILIGLGGLLLVSLAIYLSLEGGAESTSSDQRITAEEVNRVSLNEAYAAYQDLSAVFLDVRGAESFDAGHIPGAVHIPLADLASRLSELSKEDWILPYCT
jgi:3-mercaptopyruvate sulfurtransferase SseA